MDRAARREASIAERERIARGIHDSVLQVLALVSSRGKALGGDAAELGGLAAEQEAALRALITGDAAADQAAAAQQGPARQVCDGTGHLVASRARAV